MSRLTKAERELVEYAQGEFGAPLTRFLLTGLGEEAAGRGWLFTIAFADEAGAGLKRQVQAVTYEPEDGSSCLPRRKDPLVLLALLKLRLERDGPPSQELSYSQKEVLALLGRRETCPALREIDEALRRYSLLIFEWEKGRAELERENMAYYSAATRVISEYELRDERDEGGRHLRALNRVVFNSNFTGGLAARTLFDVNWDGAISMKHEDS